MLQDHYQLKEQEVLLLLNGHQHLIMIKHLLIFIEIIIKLGGFQVSKIPILMIVSYLVQNIVIKLRLYMKMENLIQRKQNVELLQIQEIFQL